MANIMIMGDSWACGEWGGSDWTRGLHSHLLHGGTRQYLGELGHRVGTVATAGSSNWAQVDRMSPHHAYQRDRGGPHSSRDTEVIIWFLTDPLRDRPASAPEPWPRTLPELRRLSDQLMRARLTLMARLMARLYPDRRLLLVGGVAPVPPWVADEFPQFQVVVTSLLHWLIPGAQPDLLPALCRIWQYPDCDRGLLDHWEQVEQYRATHMWRAEHRADSAEHQWFWPDGAHPNRHAHRRLTEELIRPLLPPVA